MKEVFGAFSSEIFRPIIGLLLPGGLAMSSYFTWLYRSYSPLHDVVRRNKTETTLLLVAIALFVGLVLEDIGTRIESKCFDSRRNKKTNGEHKREWQRHFRLAFHVETMGRKHLRNVLARLKFEIGSALGLVVAVSGIWLNQIDPLVAIMLTAFGLCLATYLFYESYATHGLLAELRHEILQPEITVGHGVG